MLILLTSCFLLVTFLGVKTLISLMGEINQEINECAIFISLKKFTFMVLLLIFSLTSFINIYQNIFAIQSQKNYNSLIKSSNEFVEMAEKSYTLLSEISDEDNTQMETMGKSLDSIVSKYNNIVSTNKQRLNDPVQYLWHLGFISPAYNDMSEVKNI